jgi:hypothetical protein
MICGFFKLATEAQRHGDKALNKGAGRIQNEAVFDRRYS